MSTIPGAIYILDTNILVRLADTSDPLHPLAQSAVENLAASGAFLHTIPRIFRVLGGRHPSHH